MNAAHVCLALVQFLLGTTTVVGKLGLRASNPVAFTAWRFVLAIPCIVLWQRGISVPAARCFPILLLGAIGLCLGNLGTTIGIALGGQVTASAWQPLQLFWAALISFTVGLESPSLHKLAGLTFGAVGAAILVVADPGFQPSLKSAPSGHPNAVWGHVALLCATCGSGIMFVVRRWLTTQSKLSFELVVLWFHLIAAPILFCFCYIAGLSDAFRVVICQGCTSLVAAPIEPDAWMAVAFYTLVPTLICQSGSAWAAKRLDPSTMAMYSILQPAASASISTVARALLPKYQSVLRPAAWNLVGAIPVIIGIRLLTHAPQSVLKKKAT